MLRRMATTHLPTRWGIFRTIAYERETNVPVTKIETAIALVLGEKRLDSPLVRIHSQCFTGEVLGSLRCDCGPQLELAMDAIAQEAHGVLIYEHQEGRGIGLMAKLQAYALQDRGLDTIEANHALGFAGDCRDFALPAEILHDLGVCRIRLLSNNPTKHLALAASGIEVVERVQCEVAPSQEMLAYLQFKKTRMGHTLTML
jgi:GTP cyclohydrolase II